MITTKQLVPFQKKVSALASQVESLEIVDATSMQSGVVILSNMNKYMDSVKEQKEKLTKPINESLKNIRAMFKPLETTYEIAIEALRGKMTKFQTESVAKARIEEQKIADRVGSGTGHLKIETAIKQIEKVETPEKEISTTSGLVQFVETKKFEVTNLAAVPVDYILPNEVAIRNAMKLGKEIPGVRYYTEMVPRNFR